MNEATCRILVAGAFLLAALTGFGVKLSDSVPNGWGEDFALAKQKAASEGKFVFLAFSGSDWCGWCVKLEKEVYSQKAFVTKAQGKFVLTMIDCPRNQEILSKLAREQNRPLAQTFGIGGFPTGIVCDSDGTEIGRIGGYVQGGPDVYLERMLEKVKGKTAKKAPESPEAKAMKDAKTELAAKRALTAFESSTKARFKKQVSELGAKPDAKTLSEAKVRAAEDAVEVLNGVVLAVSNAKVKAVYEKKLAVLRKNLEALNARSEE